MMMMNGDQSGRTSANQSNYGQMSKNSGSGAASFEPVPMDKEDDDDDDSYDDDEDGSQSVYSDDESSYESDLETSKESTHQTFNIAKKESNRVRVWRTVLSGMLVATAATVIVTTYLFLTDNEQNEFISTVSAAEVCCGAELLINIYACGRYFDN